MSSFRTSSFIVSVELSSSELFQQRVGSFILRHKSAEPAELSNSHRDCWINRICESVRCPAGRWDWPFLGNANNLVSKHLEPETERICSAQGSKDPTGTLS